MFSAGASKSRKRASPLWLAPALVIALAQPTIPAAFAVAPLQVDELATRTESALITLRNAAAPDSERVAAAKTLISIAETQAVRTALAEVLAPPITTGCPADRFLSALSKEQDPTTRLFPLVAQRLSSATPDEQPRLLDALGSFRTRESARLLGRYVNAAKPIAAAAMSSLARLSSRDDIGLDAAAWLQWLAEVENLGESQWRLRLVSALSARNQRLESERNAAIGQLTDALRKLHLATAPDKRPDLLASLLENDTPAVRDLGFELVARELSASGHLDGPVGQAALKLLAHTNPQVRANAAVLVRQLAPPGAQTAIAAALANETDPAAASDLLLAAARWPSPAVVAPVLQWIESGTPAMDAATEAAWWLSRSGELGQEPSRHVLAAVRAVPTDSMSPAAASLLATLGDDNDRQRLVPLLTAPAASLRQAAGESLVSYPQYLDAILAAAAKDPDLFDLASRALLLNEPNESGLELLLALPRPAPDVAQNAILRLAGALPANELRAVCLNLADPTIRRALLTSLTSPDRVMSEKADPKNLAAIAAGVLDLSELELSQNRIDAAFATLDAAPYAEPIADATRMASLRCTCELALGKTDNLEKNTAPIEAWLKGAELAKGTPAAPKVLDLIDARFGQKMNDDQKARLSAIRATIHASEPVGPPSPTGG